MTMVTLYELYILIIVLAIAGVKMAIEDRHAPEQQQQKQQKQQREEGKEMEKDLEDDDEDTIMRRWITSLAIDLLIENLVINLKSGAVLLTVMDRVQPGVVAWQRVHMNPKNRFEMLENGNYAIEIAKVMKLAVTTAAGVDIVDGERLVTMSILSQLMYLHTGNRLQAGKRVVPSREDGSLESAPRVCREVAQEIWDAWRRAHGYSFSAYEVEPAVGHHVSSCMLSFSSL